MRNASTAFPRRATRAALGVLLALFVAGQALAASVVINGQPLATSRTPINLSGSMLLPMRDVFEALSAEVKWFAAQQKIIAIRGATTIELSIGSRTATVNGAVLQLPVAPMLIAGSTYVPLRFPAEAFGGTVKWDGATQTAFIEIPPAVGAPSQPTQPVQPTQPAQPAEPTPKPPPPPVEGTVMQVYQTANPAVVLRLSGTESLKLLQLGSETTIVRGLHGQEPQAATAADLRVGDFARAQLDDQGHTIKLTASYGEKAGKVVALAGNTLVFADGTALTLSSNVKVTGPDNAPAPLAQITNGTQAVARFQPLSKTVWAIQLPAAAPTVGAGAGPTTPAAPETVEILTVGLLNPSTVFKAGDTLNIQLQGTPGGQATVTITRRVATGLALSEVQPGVYRADFTVPAGLEVTGAKLVGNLTKKGRKARRVVTATVLTIDNTAPAITEQLPAPDSKVNNSSPSLEVAYNDGQGSGIEATGFQLLLDEVDVTAETNVGEDRAVYNAEDLAPGAHSAVAVVSDLAGNQTTSRWGFTVAAPAGGVITAVWHNGKTVLTKGQTVNINARVVNPGGRCTFSIGEWKRGIVMKRDGNTRNYRGTYTVKPGDKITDAVVKVVYRDPQGKRGNMAATNTLSIDATLPTTLQITSPADNSAAEEEIVVRGLAPPQSTVRVTISFQTRLITMVTGQLWQGTVRANGQGEWQTPAVSSEVFLGKANKYTVLAELMDDEGGVKQQQTIELTK